MLKKYIAVVLSFIMILSLGVTASANNLQLDQSTLLETEADIIQYQLDGFAALKEQYENTPQTRASSYPTRKGVILVTDDGSFGSLVGHAGIIFSPTETVESFPSGGVAMYDNDWDTRYDTVYAASVRSTTSSEDADAADYAENRVGTPYNWIFTDVNTTSKFYCSQLVYRAFLVAGDVNLNQGGWICFPIDLIQSSNTYTVYTQ